MDSILKSIENIKAKKQTEPIIEEKKNENVDTEEVIKEVKLGEKLTLSERDAIRRQFYDCWIVPAGGKNIKEYKVSIKLKLDENGVVTFSKLINDKKLGDPFFRALAESAIRAVNHPNCKKLKVPEKKYDRWKQMILDFDPSVMIN